MDTDPRPDEDIAKDSHYKYCLEGCEAFLEEWRDQTPDDTTRVGDGEEIR